MRMESKGASPTAFGLVLAFAGAYFKTRSSCVRNSSGRRDPCHIDIGPSNPTLSEDRLQTPPGYLQSFRHHALDSVLPMGHLAWGGDTTTLTALLGKLRTEECQAFHGNVFLRRFNIPPDRRGFRYDLNIGREGFDNQTPRIVDSPQRVTDSVPVDVVPAWCTAVASAG